MTRLSHKGSVPLCTSRLILKKLEPSMAKMVFDNWASDDQVTKFMRWGTHKSVEVTLEWLRVDSSLSKEKSHYDWGIFEKEHPETPIGSIGAFMCASYPGRFEVGYALGRKYWGRGYATEALSCVMDFFINDVGIKYFVCMHAIENPASGRVMEKAGFVYKERSSYVSSVGEYECKVYFLDV